MFQDLTQRFGRWTRIRRDIRRLSQMNDQMLADMGVRRDDIADLVKGKRS